MPTMPFEKLVVIGASTGGPPAVTAVLQALDTGKPYAYLVIQHMPPGFTTTFAARLDRQSDVSVSEAQSGDSLQAGHVLVAPGGSHLVLHGRSLVEVLEGDAIDGPTPSVDAALASAAKYYAHNVIGVVLTGMGSDGTEGAKAIKKAGGTMIAQDAATSTIYGMPKCVAEAGAADIVVPLQDVARCIAAAGVNKMELKAV